MSDIQLTADFSDIQTMNRELLETAKNARSSARVFEAEFNRVERLLNKTAKTNQEYFNSVLGVGTATKSASDSAEVFNRSLNKQASEVDRLAKKFNPLYRASKQYEAAAEEIDKAHKMGAISIGQHEAALEQLNAEYARFNSGVQPAANSLYQFGQNTAFAGKNANRFGMVSQQVGYQVGDFLVQVQSGTNALVAFGQQGTQLAGLLPGVAGAVIGIGLALSTAIGGVVMRQYMERTNDLGDALKALKEETKGASEEIERLARGFSSVNALRVANEIDRLKSEIQELQEQSRVLDEATASAGFFRSGRVTERLKVLQDELDIAEERFKKEQFYESQRAITAAAVEADLRNRKAAEEEAARTASVTAQYMADMYAQIGEGVVATQELKEQLLQAYRNGEDLSKLNLEGGVNAAANAAMVLATELGISLANAKALMGISGLAGGRGTLGMPEANVDPRAAVQLAKERERLQREAFIESQRGRRPSGGGATQQKDPLEELRQRIKLETELLGKTEAQKEMIRALGVEYKESYGPQVLSTIEAEIQGLLTKQEQMEKIANLQDALANSATDLFLAAAKSTDAFKQSLASMLQTLAQAIAQQAFYNALKDTSGGQATTGFVGKIATMLGFADGGAFNRGNVMAFASGGVVSQPNFFPMAGGKTGLMGEAGPEAIMPLKRGKDGKLGVAAEGGGGSTVVKPVINIDARGAQQGVAEQINAQIAQSLPSIIDATVAASRERSRRGAM